MVRFLFTDYWKVVGLNFWEMGNTVFLWAKKMMERWYLMITEMFLFWTFQWWETWSFFSQNAEGKMVFTWSFWAFHDIPGLGQYGFSCNDCIRVRSAHNVIPILWIKWEYDLLLNFFNLNSWNREWSPRLTKLFRQQISIFAYSTLGYTQYEIYFHILSIQFF